jgi:hypothetical protein
MALAALSMCPKYERPVQPKLVLVKQCVWPSMGWLLLQSTDTVVHVGRRDTVQQHYRSGSRASFGMHPLVCVCAAAELVHAGVCIALSVAQLLGDTYVRRKH